MNIMLQDPSGQRYTAESAQEISNALISGVITDDSWVWHSSRLEWVSVIDYLKTEFSDSSLADQQTKFHPSNTNKAAVVLAKAGKGIVGFATKSYLKVTLNNRFSKALAAMLEDGKLDCEELEALQQMVTEAKGQWAEVVNECRPIAEKFIRHQLADAIADGVVTPEEESEIISNIHLFGLASSLKKEVATAIRRVRLISELRANRLPQPLAQSAPWLQSGEAVYLKKNAELTVNSAIRSSGELWITNTRIEYVASKGGGSTTLKNLRDATGKGDYLVITSVKGNREYFVDEAESIAALLLCLLRMNNRTASQAEEDDTRDDRRRISKEVRNAVWIRDGGACVECGALDYLEFDHVIPVAKGGGNGVNNIQLLCRKCNSKKSDRI